MSPMPLRRSTASATTSIPRTFADPSEGVRRVVSTFTSVVLPAPFGPKIDRNAPSGRSNVTLSSALRTPKARVRSRTSSACDTRAASSIGALGRLLLLRPRFEGRAEDDHDEACPHPRLHREELDGQIGLLLFVDAGERHEHVPERLMHDRDVHGALVVLAQLLGQGELRLERVDLPARLVHVDLQRVHRVALCPALRDVLLRLVEPGVAELVALGFVARADLLRMTGLISAHEHR